MGVSSEPRDDAFTGRVLFGPWKDTDIWVYLTEQERILIEDASQEAFWVYDHLDDIDDSFGPELVADIAGGLGEMWPIELNV